MMTNAITRNKQYLYEITSPFYHRLHKYSSYDEVRPTCMLCYVIWLFV